MVRVTAPLLPPGAPPRGRWGAFGAVVLAAFASAACATVTGLDQLTRVACYDGAVCGPEDGAVPPAPGDAALPPTPSADASAPAPVPPCASDGSVSGIAVCLETMADALQALNASPPWDKAAFQSTLDGFRGDAGKLEADATDSTRACADGAALDAAASSLRGEATRASNVANAILGKVSTLLLTLHARLGC